MRLSSAAVGFASVDVTTAGPGGVLDSGAISPEDSAVVLGRAMCRGKKMGSGAALRSPGG